MSCKRIIFLFISFISIQHLDLFCGAPMSKNRIRDYTQTVEITNNSHETMTFYFIARHGLQNGFSDDTVADQLVLSPHQTRRMELSPSIYRLNVTFGAHNENILPTLLHNINALTQLRIEMRNNGQPIIVKNFNHQSS